MPPEIARKRKPETILDFLRQQEEEGIDYIYEAKLLIIGEGGAGKTSLANKLIEMVNVRNSIDDAIGYIQSDRSTENERREEYSKEAYKNMLDITKLAVSREISDRIDRKKSHPQRSHHQRWERSRICSPRCRCRSSRCQNRHRRHQRRDRRLVVYHARCLGQ